MTRRPLPREVESIRTEADAQHYGGNVHSIAGARADRERRTWEGAVTTWEKPESRRPTLAEIMGDPDPWQPGGGAAA